MAKHKVYRTKENEDGKPVRRLYDKLDPNTHAIKQIVRGYANRHTGEEYEAEDEDGVYYSCKVTIKSKTEWEKNDENV